MLALILAVEAPLLLIARHPLAQPLPSLEEREAAALAALPGRPDAAEPDAAPLPPQDALARNNAVPFVTDGFAPAHPFRFSGSMEDRQRAEQCLALAAMAEAGPGDAGQRAVIQVILNRVRHPAFPHTICGVVFQGSERRTGCQFSFTCDGSLARRYGESAWAESRRRAEEAIGGAVFGGVGTATHFHTNWVYPYWSPSLDKIAQVDTHLFFRWRGFWGTASAASIAYRGNEPIIAAIANPGAQDAVAEATDDSAAIAIDPALQKIAGKTAQITGGKPDGGLFMVRLTGLPTQDNALGMARRLCEGKAYCKVMGWQDGVAIPTALPLPPLARQTLRFSYVRESSGREFPLYDCVIFSGIDRDQCLPRALR